MSNWVARRRQEAFTLYQRYNAMQLHFKGSTGYDYTEYGGKVRASLESFLTKPEAVNRFVKLALATNGEDNPELFVFANARYGLDIGYGDIRKYTKQFEDWKAKYGTKELMFKTAVSIIRVQFLYYGKNKTFEDIAESLFESDEDDATEALICQLHLYPWLVTRFNEKVIGNAIWELRWNNINKIRKLYYHFGILN